MNFAIEDLGRVPSAYPLARWEAWRRPHGGHLTDGCSTQRALLLDALRPDVSVNVWRGGVRSGKTVAALALCVAGALGGDHPASEAWCAVNGLDASALSTGPGDSWVCALGSNDSLRIHRRTVLDLLPADGVRTYNVGNKGEARIDIEVPGYRRPATIWFRSVEQGEDAFQGAIVRWGFFDEELHDPRWRQVVTQTSLRVGAEPTRLILAYAPKHGRIWIDDEYIDSGRADVRYHRIAARDNPHLVGEARAQLLRTLASLPEAEQLALGEGLAVPRGGRVWPQWSPSIHLVDPPDPTGPGGCPADWPRYLGADFGYESGNVVLWLALSPRGEIYTYRELYTSGWTGRANAREAVRLSGEEQIGRGWGDSSRPETIAEYRDCGLPMQKAIKDLHGLSVVGEELAGKRLLDSCSRCAGGGCDACEQSGRVVAESSPPSLYVVRGTCPGLCREIPGYMWAPGKDAPVKRNDHACDAWRYGIVGIRKARWSPDGLSLDFGPGGRVSPWRGQ